MTGSATSSSAATATSSNGALLVTRYDKHALTYRAAIVLYCVITWTKALSDMP